jgi:hypothetical protein
MVIHIVQRADQAADMRDDRERHKHMPDGMRMATEVEFPGTQPLGDSPLPKGQTVLAVGQTTSEKRLKRKQTQLNDKAGQPANSRKRTSQKKQPITRNRPSSR